MALSPKECDTLLNLISEGSVESLSLEALVIQLHNKFTKGDYYKVGCALVLLLQQPDLLPHPPQRIAVIALLHELYRGEPIANSPFSAVFVHLMHPLEPFGSGRNLEYIGQLPLLSAIEKKIVMQILNNGTKDAILKKTAKALLLADNTNMPSPNVDLTSVQLALAERQSELAHCARTGIPVVFADPDPSADSPTADDVIKKLISGNDPPIHKINKTEFVTLAPPLHRCEDELVWLNVTSPKDHTIAYDATMCISNSTGKEARKLMSKAFSGTLTLQQQQHLLAELDNDSKLVYHIGLTPTKLPDLVENNPLIAIEVLLKLMQSKQITEYFSVLVNMEMSLHSMEVVNRLTTTVDLPTEFVHLYISNCISTCETIKDRYMQNRLVRLVCVFLQSLIRNKIINVQELFIEIEAFCIDFSRIREAAALYRLLKQIESEEVGSPTATTTKPLKLDG